MPRRTNEKMPTPRDCEIFRRVVIHGQRQTEVARELGLTKQRVFSICERLRRMSFRELVDDVKDYRRTTLLRLENLHSEAIAAWERSKGGTKSETMTVGQADSDVVSTTRSETFGNPRFLAEARSALAGIRELCGLNALQKVEIRSTHDVYLDIDRLPRDERERMAEIHRLEQSGLIRFVDDGGEGVGEGSI
ncbi:MAG: TrfB-related DNA-binding protein [Planctomycetaceae bacterium]